LIHFYKRKKKMFGPVVFFDLETTGFLSNNGPPPQIINIGAIGSRGDTDAYEGYLQPTRKIAPGASAVNGFTTNRDFTSLYLNGVEVDADDMRSGLQLFVNWLYSFFDEPVLLVAHNCFNFDAKILLRNLDAYRINYDSVIGGFADSYIASKINYPGVSHKLNNMLHEVGIYEDQNHTGLDDAYDVKRMVKRMARAKGSTLQKFIRNDRWCKTLDEVRANLYNRR